MAFFSESRKHLYTVIELRSMKFQLALKPRTELTSNIFELQSGDTDSREGSVITDFIRFGDADGSTCTAKAKSWRAKLKTFQNSRNRRYVLNKCTDPSLQVHQSAHYIYIYIFMYILITSNNYVVLSNTALCLSLSLSRA